MSKTTAFLFIVGFLLTFGAVGGIEQSITNAELIDATLIAVVGLGIMWCGVLKMRVDKHLHRDRTVDNPALW